MSNTATVVANPGHPGFTAVKRETAGRSIVVEQRVNASGQTHVIAYRQMVSSDGHTTTRVYTDGRRSIEGSDYHSSGQVGGPQFVHYHNGLRSAYAQNGRPLYAESFTNRSGSVVQRTTYAINVDGNVRELPTPVRRYYTVTPVRGYDTFVYRPMVYAVPFYALLYAPLALPIVVGPHCLVCPDAHAVFAVPQDRYSDPIELLGDMQIAGAVTDQGVAPIEEATADPAAQPVASDDTPTQTDPAAIPDTPPPPPRELVAAASGADAANLGTLKRQADELRAQAAARAQTETPGAINAAATSGVDLPGDTLAVPEDVRAQIHKQVRLSLAQHAREHPLNLIDIIQSGYSRIYLFQVAGAIDTVSAITGDGCALGSGDLIAFTSLGDSQQHPTAQMKVVTARPGHCLSHDMVDVSIGDLQDMLNTFNQRLEENMRKLHACAAAKDGCVRT